MKSNKILWVLAILLVAVFGAQQLQASEGVDVKQAQRMVNQGALLLDVRETVRDREPAGIRAADAAEGRLQLR